MKTKRHNKTQGAPRIGSSAVLGSIEFAVITPKSKRSITLDFLNGHPVKLNRRQADALCHLIGLNLRGKSAVSNEHPVVCVRGADEITMSGKPASLPRLKVYSATNIQSETALTSPRKNRQGYNVREYRVGSYKCKCGVLPNEKS